MSLSKMDDEVIIMAEKLADSGDEGVRSIPPGISLGREKAKMDSKAWKLNALFRPASRRYCSGIL